MFQTITRSSSCQKQCPVGWPPTWGLPHFGQRRAVKPSFGKPQVGGSNRSKLVETVRKQATLSSRQGTSSATDGVPAFASEEPFRLCSLEKESVSFSLMGSPYHSGALLRLWQRRSPAALRVVYTRLCFQALPIRVSCHSAFKHVISPSRQDSSSATNGGPDFASEEP